VDITASSLLAPFATHFVLSFVGKRGRFIVLLRVLYIWFGGIALLCAASLFSDAVRHVVDSPLRTYPVLLTAGPTAAFVLYLLGTYRLRAITDEDRLRSALVMTAFAIGTVGALTELFAEIGWSVTRLGAPLTLCSTIVLGIVVLRWKLFGSELSNASGVLSAFVGILVVSAYVAGFDWLSNRRGALIFATTAVAFFVIAIVARSTARSTDRRARLEHHATMGRFSGQLAHDLRNPLAAMKGALQLMEPDESVPQSSRELLSLLQEQVTRMERVLVTYQRLGRVEPVFADVDVRAMLNEVVGAQRHAAPASVHVQIEFGDDTPKALSCDKDLVTAALENVIRNAFEAMPDGGRLIARTHSVGGERPGLTIEITDTGSGIDAAVHDSLGRDFFTTKANGSGLGLSFTRRVLEAHGGTLAIASQKGQGTTVSFTFPARVFGV
jgi:two-component system sensor histidine kinase HydH